MYKLKLHKNLDQNKWITFSRDQQLLMIANELNRAKNWVKKGDKKEIKSAYERALELLDLTISVINKKSMLKELLRFREILSSEYLAPKMDTNIIEKLIKVLLSLNSKSAHIYASAKIK